MSIRDEGKKTDAFIRQPGPKGTSFSRRGFIKAGAYGAGLTAASVCAGCSLFITQKKADKTFAASAKTVTLSFSDYPSLSKPGGVARIISKDGDTRIIVFRNAQSKVMALSMSCTHFGSDVDYVPEEGTFECPSHGSRFDAAGQVLEGPADEALRTYKLSDDGAGITIQLS